VSIGFAVLTSLLAAASLALPPNGTVALEMARDESAPLYRFIAPLRSARHAASLAAVDADALPWFAPRTEQPEVPPTAERPAPPPDLVLVLTIDAFRYDVWTGQGNGTLFRNLKQLARQSVEVENAHSVGSLTVPSVSSMLSGLYFSQRYWSRTPFLKGYRTFLTRDTSPGLCDLLRERGVIAATVPATDGLKPEFGVVRGCETIGPDFTGNRTSADMMPMLLEWIDGISLEKPAFVYAHFLDGHHPYDLAGKDGTPLERQRRELALVDAQIGVLVGELKRAKLWERTAIVITADHGESFGEHGATNHGANIHEELTRVPMIIRVPGARPRVVKEPASGIDVTPTVLDILGLPTPGTVMGQSLLPLVFGQDVKLTRPIVFDSSKQQRGMLFRDGIKVIHRGLESSFELYDLNTDPGELTNLVDTHPDAENRIGALVAFFDAHTLRKFGYRIPTR
jgi:arylsulfatase A-like enzyme